MDVVITPTVGQAYKFTFDSKYSAADGIYRTDKIMTYEEYVSEGNSILEDFYEACSLSQSDVEEDIAILRKSLIVEVSPPDDNTKIKINCFPFSFVVQTPDHNINRYHKFGLIAYCGITDNIDQFSFVKDNIKELISANIGIDPEPYWVDIGYQWMTENDYNEQINKQKEITLKTINYFTENIRLERQYTNTVEKFNSYENIILNQRKQIEDLTAEVEDLKQQLEQATGGSDQ